MTSFKHHLQHMQANEQAAEQLLHAILLHVLEPKHRKKALQMLHFAHEHLSFASFLQVLQQPRTDNVASAKQAKKLKLAMCYAMQHILTSKNSEQAEPKSKLVQEIASESNQEGTFI